MSINPVLGINLDTTMLRQVQWKGCRPHLVSVGKRVVIGILVITVVLVMAIDVLHMKNGIFEAI